MNKVLYLGNKFYSYKKVNSVLETLEPLLAEFCEIKTASDKKNQAWRFLDMFYHFFKYGLKADKIIIDVYSTNAFYFAYLLSLLSALFRKKYILFLHGGNLPARFQQSPKMVSRIFRKAEKIIAPSTYLQSFFQSKGFNVEYIPNIIELEKYPFLLRKQIRPHLLALRGFGKPYNPLMTLQAVKELKNTVPDLKLLMLGNEDDFYYDDVIHFIENHQLHDIVTVQPKCTRDEWVALSQDYDIMISNPIIDNTPVSLIEGLALGMCVITTKVGGVPFLVSDNEVEFINNKDDFKEEAHIIYQLTYNVNRCSELSFNARKKAEQFGWFTVKNRWKWLLYE